MAECHYILKQRCEGDVGVFLIVVLVLLDVEIRQQERNVGQIEICLEWLINLKSGEDVGELPELLVLIADAELLDGRKRIRLILVAGRCHILSQIL